MHVSIVDSCRPQLSCGSVKPRQCVICLAYWRCVFLMFCRDGVADRKAVQFSWKTGVGELARRGSAVYTAHRRPIVSDVASFIFFTLYMQKNC